MNPRNVLCLSLAVADLPEMTMGKVHRTDKLYFNTITSSDVILMDRNVVDSKDPYKYALGVMNPQILPYTVVTYAGKVLTYSREKGEEARLHGTRSIGFGGHIDEADVVKDAYDEIDVHATLVSGLFRELKEEIGLDAAKHPTIKLTEIPAIFDYTNEVGSVHVGLVSIVELTEDAYNSLNINPDEIADAQWIGLDQLMEDFHKYENWSRYIMGNNL